MYEKGGWQENWKDVFECHILGQPVKTGDLNRTVVGTTPVHPITLWRRREVGFSMLLLESRGS
jgi:hypothetical protein